MADQIRFSDVKVGDVIAGRYKLEAVINPDNGEAATFTCDYEGWSCHAKIYYDDKMPDKEVIEKQRSVSSTHIIKKMDQNVYNKHLYQIMPKFNGNIMSKPVNDKIITEVIVPGVVDALKAIHELGIIHGNVKPSNIYYGPMGDAILGDFGVAFENIGDCGKNIAMNYLPPEAQNGVYDAKADYYSLGITLYQLVTGKNPFEGLNKRQLLKTTSTMELELPPKTGPVVQQLVKGLTVKDYNTRWGAEEVERFLAGEEVEVIDEFVYVPPVNEFEFAGAKYTDMTNLVAAFASNWFEAVDAVRSEAFGEFVEGLPEEIAESINNILTEVDVNKVIFNLIYAFNDEIPFCWKGASFADFEGFANEMMSAENKEIYRNILADGAWVEYLKLIGADDDVLSNVARLCDDAKNDMDAAILANKIDYLLTGNYVYMLEGIQISDINTLTSYIQMNVSEVKDLCSQFIYDPRFFAWLEVLGYGAQISQWRREVGA